LPDQRFNPIIIVVLSNMLMAF